VALAGLSSSCSVHPACVVTLRSHHPNICNAAENFTPRLLLSVLLDLVVSYLGETCCLYFQLEAEGAG
jgi:hypothetical protein